VRGSYSSDRRFEYRTHARWTLLLFGAAFVGIGFRFFDLQVLHGRDFERLSQIQQIGRARIPARRGKVRDRSGRVLARNVPTHEAYAIPARVRRPAETATRVADLLLLTDQERGDLHEALVSATGTARYDKVVIRRGLVGDRCPADNNRLDLLEHPHRHFWCTRCGRTFERWQHGLKRCVLDGGSLLVREEGRLARCKKCGLEYLREPTCPYDGSALRNVEAALRCRVCGRRHNDEVAMLRARKSELPGVFVDTDFRRDYPYGPLAAHVIGYVNEVNREEVDREPEIYRPGDQIGRRGLERAMEPDLRGEHGEYIFLRRKDRVTRADRAIIDALRGYQPQPAAAGHNVVLTLDVEIQQILARALEDEDAGAAVVVEPHSGAVLGWYSKPSFDPNHWAGRMTRALLQSYDDNHFSPMLDRVGAAYAPGSVYKVVTALAALEDKQVDHTTRIDCPGHYEFAKRRFHCHMRTGHGSMDLHAAIAESCDVYFYRVGEALGMERLHHYAREIFGLGRKTGVEVRESAGWIPSRDSYYRGRRKVRFRPGWTLSTSVGQGNVLTTPLQIAQLYAGIAAKGRVPRLHLVDHVTDVHGKVVRRTHPESVTQLPFTEEQIELVRHALWAVIHEDKGTARRIVLDDMDMAGKTGTAEAPERRKGASRAFAEWLLEDHAWFSGYAPAERPEIVVVVLLEHGGSGGLDAAPLFQEIVQQIFDRRLNLPQVGAP